MYVLILKFPTPNRLICLGNAVPISNEKLAMGKCSGEGTGKERRDKTAVDQRVPLWIDAENMMGSLQTRALRLKKIFSLLSDGVTS